MLVDSEYPVANIEKTWEHLKQRDNWDRPAGADDEHVLLMTTCMETWIATDRRGCERISAPDFKKARFLSPIWNREAVTRFKIRWLAQRGTARHPM